MEITFDWEKRLGILGEDKRDQLLFSSGTFKDLSKVQNR